MIQKPVLVFGVSKRSAKASVELYYDLLTTAEYLVDAWRPGHYFYRNLVATIMIGGGSVKPISDRAHVLHWSRDILPHHQFPVTFDAKAMVLVRQDVKANTGCNFNLGVCK